MSKSNSDWQFSEETLISMVLRLIDRKNELVKELNKTDYSIGLLDGYNQSIDIIKNDLESRGYDVKDFGL